MMKTNPHFRVLALTATPGNTPEQVQPIIDNLHISHIAIRNDSSPDIKQYTHKKIFEHHIIKMDYFIDELCMQWEDIVKQAIDPLIERDMLPEYTINRLRKLHPYQITSLRNKIQPHQKYLFGSLGKAEEAIRAIRNLVSRTLTSQECADVIAANTQHRALLPKRDRHQREEARSSNQKDPGEHQYLD